MASAIFPIAFLCHFQQNTDPSFPKPKSHVIPTLDACELPISPKITTAAKTIITAAIITVVLLSFFFTI